MWTVLFSLVSLSLSAPLTPDWETARIWLSECAVQQDEARRAVHYAGLIVLPGKNASAHLFRFADERALLLSDEAVQFIIRQEIGSPAYYDRFLQTGHVPRNQRSGATIGIGFDLGQHSPADIRNALWRHLPPRQVFSLCRLAGRKGDAAREAFSHGKKVTIPLPLAEEIFLSRTLSRFVGETVRIFPETLFLHPDAAGALVSLVFNRGASLKSKTNEEEKPDRRQGMANIQRLLREGNLSKVAEEIREMKTLAEKNETGLIARREAEAQLFEQGLAAQWQLCDTLRGMLPPPIKNHRQLRRWLEGN